MARNPGRNQKRQEEAQPGKRPDDTARRTCLISRTIHPRAHLLRFVAAPREGLTEDVAGRLPGRGVSIQPTRRHCVALLRRQDLPRRLGVSTLVLPPGEVLQGRVAQALERRLIEGIGLARRAGRILPEWSEAEVERLFSDGGQPLLLLARDAPDAVRDAMAALASRHAATPPLAPFDREVLGRAGGWKEAIALVIPAGKIARRIEADATRWITFSSP
ncbi:MAG: DUF448 domain-containing protein [Magnetococcales bacterium]|nr:DUF448 domain-containing protein [Magnetococcales bacterium]